MYSHEPTALGQHQIDCPELMFVQYMPIAMPGKPFRIPRNLYCFMPLLEAIPAGGMDPFSYVYLTAKHTYVNAASPANRPGWHTDGFGTDDINFIWSDTLPTEFCIQEFTLSDDHDVSMQQMAEQARAENIKTYPAGSLLMLDSAVVHRVAPHTVDGFRTFVKISVSRERYNLIGNAHNYLFDYDWPMVERQAARNHPVARAA